MLVKFLSKRFRTQNEPEPDLRRDSRLSHTSIGHHDTDDVVSPIAQCPTAHPEQNTADVVPDPNPSTYSEVVESRDPSSVRGMISTKRGSARRRVRRKVSQVFSKLNVVRRSRERERERREAAHEKWRAELFGWDRDPWRREGDIRDMQNWDWGQDYEALKEKCMEHVEDA